MKHVIMLMICTLSMNAFAESNAVSCYKLAKTVLAKDFKEPFTRAKLLTVSISLCADAATATGPVDCYLEAKEALAEDGVSKEGAIDLCSNAKLPYSYK